jgi:steroid 5-alpha reductase family enzyme
MWQWQPIDAVVWSVSSGPLYYALVAVFAIGWFMVPAVSLMINHFDLFGLRQTWFYLRGRPLTPLAFRTPMLYAHVRHPLYIGWALLFWATPTMTAGHLLFAFTLTAYMGLASIVEERDLIRYFGHLYENYRREVPAFVPRLRPVSSQPEIERSPDPASV